MNKLCIILAFSLSGCATSSGGSSAPQRSKHENAKVSPLNRSIEISRFRGQTYFEAMRATDGIKQAFDEEEMHEFQISASKIRAAAGAFDKRLLAKVNSEFKTSDGWDMFVKALDGQRMKPSEVAAIARAKLIELNLLKDGKKAMFVAVSVAPFLALSSGAGTMIHVEGPDSFYNIGFKPGSTVKAELARQVHSGHSFAAGPNHGALEVLDVDVLNQAGGAFSKDRDVEPFFKALLAILVSCDPSGVSALSPELQTLLTDFLAVYTLELDRYLMTGMQSHARQNDLAEVLFLSAYGAAAGKVERGGVLTDGTPVDYFSVSAKGSGIFVTESDRRKLQKRLTSIARRLHAGAVMEIEHAAGGGTVPDAFNLIAAFLNNPENSLALHMNGDAFRAAAVQFLVAIHNDAEKLTPEL